MTQKSVLVTGADGFIGSHMVEKLYQTYRGNIKIRALSLYNSFNFWGWLEDLPIKNKIEIVTGDIRDPGMCKKITRGIDVIYNLAALIAIPYSYEAPASYVDTNVRGTLNICQAALENKCGRLIQISTSEVYGTARYVPIDEDHPLQPQSPYSASKIGGDQIAMSFYYAYGLPVTIARPFNTYGPRQSARAIIPTIIIQLASGVSEINLGDLRPTRDFTYVEDTCSGIIADSGRTVGEVVNLGSSMEISISALFQKISEMMNKKCRIRKDETRLRPEISEVFRLRCDNSRLVKMTGFMPSISMDEGLRKTIEWFSDKKNLSRYKNELYNI
jgi:NAD dependent epimerase/dehydratase